MAEQPVVHAAVAVLIRQDNTVLLAQRPVGKPWAGWWEFPGGKIEAGETALQALHREVEEELGVALLETYPWVTRTYAYPEKTVQLHFYSVRRWQGEPHGREGQVLSWEMPHQLSVSPVLPANTAILSALTLPPVYAITNCDALGEREFFKRLYSALQSGLRLIQVREKQLSQDSLKSFAIKVVTMARSFNARVLINGNIDLAREVSADGVHLTSQQLMALQDRPADLLCAASCHNAQELNHAQQYGLDFVVCSPVLSTLSHPGAASLGWEAFGELIQSCAIPVYALGGLSEQDMDTAWQHGAHGIAMQRAIWNVYA